MHGSATTSPDIRRAIQKSRLSVRKLAVKYGVNPKTISKWKARHSTRDMPMGPHSPRQKSLTPTEEATCVGFRNQAMLPLDDCLYALQLMFPHLTRSTLHRLFQRHGIHRLPNLPTLDAEPNEAVDGDKIGHFYIDAGDIRTGDGRASMIFAFDRMSKIAFARLYEHSNPGNGSAFLADLLNAIPYKIQSVLTGSGDKFADHSSSQRPAPNDDSLHPFDLACRSEKIDHHLLSPDQPWGRIGAIKSPFSGTQTPGVQYESHDELREHFLAFFETYNFERRLKTLRGLTPFEFVCECWKEEPESFRHAPQSYGRMLNG